MLGRVQFASLAHAGISYLLASLMAYPFSLSRLRVRVTDRRKIRAAFSAVNPAGRAFIICDQIFCVIPLRDYRISGRMSTDDLGLCGRLDAIVLAGVRGICFQRHAQRQSLAGYFDGWQNNAPTLQG